MRKDGGSLFQGDGVGNSVGSKFDRQVVNKCKDRMGRGIKHKGKETIGSCLQRARMRAGEKKGG